jgi:hypothetical protein
MRLYSDLYHEIIESSNDVVCDVDGRSATLVGGEDLRCVGVAFGIRNQY